MKLPEGLVVRPMAAGDVDAVLALERASEGAPHWVRDEYLACVEPRVGATLRRFGLVGWTGNAGTGKVLAGFAMLRVVSIADEVEAELESIVVAAELRGRGIGAGLLAALIDLARDCGAGGLDLEVRASNEVAIRLYERVGLVEFGRRLGYYSHPEEDAVLMRVKL
jgi:ribosomal-protein-alanine N-acetyltransferase